MCYLTRRHEMDFCKIEKVCRKGYFDKIKQYHQALNIDINHDLGLFTEIVLLRRDINLFKKNLDLGVDIHINNNYIIKYCLQNDMNQIIFKFLIQQMQMSNTRNSYYKKTTNLNKGQDTRLLSVN